MWAVKFVSGYSAVGVKMKMWKFWDNDCCPCCDHPGETTDHLLTCPHASLRKTYIDGLQELKKWLDSVYTHPEITSCLLRGLGARTTDSFARYASAGVQQAALEQDRIGWVNLWFGRTSCLWQTLQERYYRHHHPTRSVQRWSAGLVTQLLGICHDLWIARNEVLHDRSPTSRTAEEVNASIQEQFQLGTDGLRYEDAHLIDSSPIDKILARSVEHKRLWLDSIVLAREQGIAALAAERNSMRGFMYNWLDHG